MYNSHYNQPLSELLTLAEQQDNTLALAIHEQANQSEALTDDITRTLSDSCKPDGDEYRAIVGDTIYHHSDVIIDLNLSASWLANWLKEYYA